MRTERSRLVAYTDAPAGFDAADAALASGVADGQSQRLTPRTLRVLRHRRKFPRAAKGISGRGTILAQDALQQELEGRHRMEGVPSDQGAISVVATKATSPIPGVASYRYSISRLLKGVVREIRTLRSVGAGRG